MAQCSRCASDLPPDAIFCPQCAQRVPARAPAPPSGAVPAAAPVGVAAIGVGGTISGVETIAGVGLSRPLPGLAEGDVFDERYTVECQLGAGAMGVVYAAMDQVTGRKVALKLINPALAERPSARERFMREGLMARDVRHPNVVAMYHVGDAGGQIYLVMEYLAGDSLRKWLRRSLQDGRDVSFDAARGIIRGILEGLSAAHVAGVVHRDLKPENVMLTGDPHEGDCRLKILDFGIARAVGASSHATTTASSTGTPLYMAPEQKTAADTVGPAADLYAVTAMLYELLIGVAPEGRWAAASHERHDLPAGIDEVIERGLANRPRSRYQTAEEYIKALDAVGAPAEPLAPQPPDAVGASETPDTVGAGLRARQVFADPPLGRPPEQTPAESARRWDWLKARSPAWALWNRLSWKGRVVLSLVLLLGFLIIVAVALLSNGSTPPPFAAISGRWADELTGTGVAVSFTDVSQQGNQVAGPIYNAYGAQVGQFSGQLQGDDLEYAWVAADGSTGTGRGRLRADGIHLDVETYDNNTGVRQRHTLHKNHMPPD